VTLTQAVKDEARRLGFSLAGVTTAEPPPHLSALEHWLSLGRNASMSYMSDPRRREPLQVLPGCRSILVLAVRYPNPGTWSRNKNPPATTGCVAAYAWGQDYHLVLPGRMEQLVGFIETQVGSHVNQRCATDSAPLLERDLAQRAGLGWIGKNTCLIHPQMGSCFLLAEILLDIELDADPPFTADRCGRCTRCITACPTGCILPDRTLDARQCLSYLTIENKQEIPVNLRKQVRNHIFGCDICMQVCPWNRFAERVDDPSFQARGNLPHPDLKTELSLSPQEFDRKFAGSPILRSKRSGYLRNVAVALGNSGDIQALPALEKALLDPEPLVREHAGWALKQIRSGEGE
jgi:epoxyqueuosine reductase